MADAYNIKIEILRRKSRILLTQLAENSRNVDNEIRKLGKKSLTCVTESTRGPTSSWRIRNDSTGVNELLNPSTHLSDQEMTVGGRILISSKRPTHPTALRKPIPGCYCTRKSKKVQYRSARTISKPFEQCHYCKSHFDVCARNVGDTEAAPVSPALSCETLQKVQSITYTPRSEFLRRVQKKISQQFSTCPEHSQSSLHASRHSSHRSVEHEETYSDENETREIGGASNGFLQKETSKRSIRNEVVNIHDDSTVVDPHPGERIEVPVEVHRADESCIITSIHGAEDDAPTIDRTNKSTRKSSSKSSRVRHKSKTPERREFSPEIETILPPRVSQSKVTKSIPKKTITSTKCDPKRKDKDEKTKKVVRTLSQKSCAHDCCLVNERRRSSKKSSKCVDCCRHSDRCLSRLASAVVVSGDEGDKEALELRKFREKNFFDTHGSTQTVMSSASSGSLEQFELNSRLFPEPVGKIHRDNIVVSMPPYVTKQLKRIHYFPRFIVQQDKKTGASNCSKKRQRSCPLTGHAIDLGILRPTCPSNSLALKYQKGVI